MALDLQMEFVSSNFTNKKIILADITGIDAGDGSTGGYGLTTQSANPSKLQADQEIDGWVFTVTRPDATTFTVSINDLQFDNTNARVEITVIDTLELANGEWTFTLVCNEQGGTLDTLILTKYIYNTDATDRLLNAKFATDIDFCNSLDYNCNKSLASLFSYNQGLKAAIDQGNTVKADYLSAQLTKLLS